MATGIDQLYGWVKVSGEENNPLSLAGFDSVSSSLVTVLTELSQTALTYYSTESCVIS
jgi:hypothetical protein